MLKRKAYDRLLAWKRERQGSTAVLLEGARRVGKSTLTKRVGTQYVLHPKQLKVEGDRVCLPLYMGWCL